jgi:hypothetical protein
MLGLMMTYANVVITDAQGVRGPGGCHWKPSERSRAPRPTQAGFSVIFSDTVMRGSLSEADVATGKNFRLSVVHATVF